MSQALKIVTPAGSDPVSVSEAKTYLRVDTSSDDTMIVGFISAATRLVEEYTGRKLITQTWDFFMDAFPGSTEFDNNWHEGVREGALSAFFKGKKFIQIPFFPLQSVTYLKTYDDDNTDSTMSASEYFVDTASEPGRLSLKNSGTWPTTFLRPTNGVQIRFVCGYGAAGTDVPHALRQAILELTGKFYLQRGCEDSSIPDGLIALLQPYRVMRL